MILVDAIASRSTRFRSARFSHGRSTSRRRDSPRAAPGPQLELGGDRLAGDVRGQSRIRADGLRNALRSEPLRNVHAAMIGGQHDGIVEPLPVEHREESRGRGRAKQLQAHFPPPGPRLADKSVAARPTESTSGAASAPSPISWTSPAAIASTARRIPASAKALASPAGRANRPSDGETVADGGTGAALAWHKAGEVSPSRAVSNGRGDRGAARRRS